MPLWRQVVLAQASTRLQSRAAVVEAFNILYYYEHGRFPPKQLQFSESSLGDYEQQVYELNFEMEMEAFRSSIDAGNPSPLKSNSP